MNFSDLIQKTLTLGALSFYFHWTGWASLNYDRHAVDKKIAATSATTIKLNNLTNILS